MGSRRMWLQNLPGCKFNVTRGVGYSRYTKNGMGCKPGCGRRMSWKALERYGGVEPSPRARPSGRQGMAYLRVFSTFS